MTDKEQQNKPNKFVSALKKIFVYNIGWKLLAIASAAVIWALAAGLW